MATHPMLWSLSNSARRSGNSPSICFPLTPCTRANTGECVCVGVGVICALMFGSTPAGPKARGQDPTHECTASMADAMPVCRKIESGYEGRDSPRQAPSSSHPSRGPSLGRWK